MRVLGNALLTGPYDWDPALVPRAEYDDRLVRLRALMRTQGLAAVLVQANTADHAALCWLTGYVPKLGPAFGLVPADGAPRIAVSGGPAMLSSAKRQTWVEDVGPFRDIDPTVAGWVGALPADAAVGLAGEAAMASYFVTALDRVAGSRRIVSLDAEVDALRRARSAVELGLARRAAAALNAACAAFRTAVAGGAGARAAMLAAERAAYARGAQDVRVLASARAGGAPLPLEGTADPTHDPMLACLAVRFAGIWADAWITVAAQPGAAAAAVGAGLDALAAAARPGATAATLAAALAPACAGFEPHPAAAGSLGNGIGLLLEEAPSLVPAGNSALGAGDVVSLRIGVIGAGGAAVGSILVAIGAAGAEILWR